MDKVPSYNEVIADARLIDPETGFIIIGVLAALGAVLFAWSAWKWSRAKHLKDPESSGRAPTHDDRPPPAPRSRRSPGIPQVTGEGTREDLPAMASSASIVEGHADPQPQGER